MSFCRPITRLVRAAAAAFWLVTMNANAVAMSTQTTKIVLSAIERDSLKFMCLSSSPRVEPESNCSAKGCEPYKKLRPSIVRRGRTRRQAHSRHGSADQSSGFGPISSMSLEP